ncbi:MAG: DUF2127 domain-containing protein [Proteobacteria bacterium]|nr:DUF2127 domain-containing protein [Pseudomonadota bacterium]
MRRPDPRLGVLRAIAAFKISKVLLLLAAAYGVLRLREPTVIAGLYTWAASLPSGMEQEWVRRALVFVSGLSPARINALGFVTLAYAAVFTTEGVGLWMGKRWAEWLTTILTSSLIPVEIWEMAHRPGLGKAVVIAVNVFIVWYLVRQLRQRPE